MVGSGRWIKSLINMKKPEKDDLVLGANGKGRKWKLWRNSSGSKAGGYQSASEASETSSVMGPAEALNAALAAVARAPAKDFRILRQEWAAIRIQTAFRGFLARRALRALKAIVRIQALVRGRQVRKQAAVTLKCMHALVRVQARVRARRAHLTAEELESKGQQNNWRESNTVNTPIETEETWCNNRGTLAEVKTKLQLKQEGSIKRERAMSYALSQMQRRSMQSSKPSSPSTFSRKTVDSDKSTDLTWLDRWMATKPWEEQEKTMDQVHARNSHHSERDSVRVKRNNMTTRISMRPPLGPSNGRFEAQSASSSEIHYTESSTISSPQTPISKPSYMNETKAAKARQEALNAERRSGPRRQMSGDAKYFNRASFASVDSDHSSFVSKGEYNKGRNSVRRSVDKENYVY